MKLNSILNRIISKISNKLSLQLAYFHNRKKWPNLKEPKDLSELWIKYLLEGKPKENYSLADKYRVREFIKIRGYENTLTPLLGVYETPNQINFENLPDRFALKMNYGAGMNIICTNKSDLNIEDVNNKLNKWLKQAGKYSFSESHYNLISPKIICEEFIDDGSGNFPTDYKFMCLKGKVCSILACSNRGSGHASYLPYDPDWTPRYDYHKGGHDVGVIPRPNNLDNMIKVAEDLAKGFDLMRVDLYSNGNRIWFGEMTLTPAGCIFHRWTQKALDELGYKYKNL